MVVDAKIEVGVRVRLAPGLRAAEHDRSHAVDGRQEGCHPLRRLQRWVVRLRSDHTGMVAGDLLGRGRSDHHRLATPLSPLVTLVSPVFGVETPFRGSGDKSD
ncbi:MAG: hypothetical protein ACR2JC_05245 [Chloroflexota bacterium]